MVLKNRICIVTGGSSGIGRGIALEFAREGARIAIVDRQETPLRGKYHETDTTTPNRHGNRETRRRRTLPPSRCRRRSAGRTRHPANR